MVWMVSVSENYNLNLPRICGDGEQRSLSEFQIVIHLHMLVNSVFD